MRPEDSRDILKRGLQVLEDKGVRLGQAGNALMELGVNQIDKEGVEEDS